MKVIVDESKDYEEIQVTIKCPQLDEEVLKLMERMKDQDKKLIGILENTRHILDPNDIYYVESVDKKTFAYTKDKVYEIQEKLYQIEERNKSLYFFRSSKSSVINASKIKQIKPSFSGRIEVILENGEKLVVSRQYVQELKGILGF